MYKNKWQQLANKIMKEELFCSARCTNRLQRYNYQNSVVVAERSMKENRKLRNTHTQEYIYIYEYICIFSQFLGFLLSFIDLSATTMLF